LVREEEEIERGAEEGKWRAKYDRCDFFGGAIL